MLPLQKLEDTDDFMNQPPEDDYLLFSTSESNKKTKLKQIRTSKNVCQVTMTMILYYRVSAKILPYIWFIYSTLILDRIISCLSSVVISFKMGIFPFSLRDDRWHLPRFRCSNSLAEKSLFRQLNFCNFPKRISKRFLPWYNSPCLILTEVLEMDNKKTCADCINLGREVYCMKCKRIKNGYKDLFVDAAPVQAKPPVVSKM